MYVNGGTRFTGFQAGDRGLGSGALGLGMEGGLSFRDAASRLWGTELSDGQDGDKDVEDGEEAADMEFEHMMQILQEDPPQEFASPLLLRKEMEPSFGQSCQQDQAMAPNTPAVPEAHHEMIMVSAPSSNGAVHHSWPLNLNEGEGFGDVTEAVSMVSQHQHSSFVPPHEYGYQDLDRLKHTDGSVLASNWRPTARSSPAVSINSGSNSSTPMAIADGDFAAGESQRLASMRYISSNGNLGVRGIARASIVDLTGSDSDGEVSELREFDLGSQGKRKHSDGAHSKPKRRREAASDWPLRNQDLMQPIDRRIRNLQGLIGKVDEEPSSLSNRFSFPTQQAWTQTQYDRLGSSASSFKGFPSAETFGNPVKSAHFGKDMNGNLGMGKSNQFLNLAQRSSSGEVSTSYENRGMLRIPPSSVGGSPAVVSNGPVNAMGADGGSSLKRTEEMAYHAVLQAFSLAEEREEASPDKGLLAVPLLKHQRIALAWMQKRESGRQDPCGGILADDQGLGKTISTVALILKNRAPIQKSGSKSQHALLEASTVDLDDDEDDQFLREKRGRQGNPEPSNGSLLPTGMGSSNDTYHQHDEGKSSQSSSKGRPAAGTLVVCPTSVLRQWAQEIRDKVTAEADLSVLLYHGSNRTRDPQELAKYDVVLSTFSIVSMEVPKQPLPDEKDDDKRNAYDYGFIPFTKPKKEKVEKAKKVKGKGRGRLADGQSDPSIPLDSGPLARVAWFRVVLDEAQSIKNCRTQVARAAWGLRAKRRWCLSGTPIQNSVDDLFSYFRFLRYFPWDAYKKFRYDIKDPVVRTPTEGYRKLQAILKPVVLRRTKATLIDGVPIVKLPPRIVKLKQAEFSTEERAFYSNLESESRAQFQVYAAAGTVSSNYVNILWMLLRLRQACDHPMLVKKCHKAQVAYKAALDSARKLPLAQRLELMMVLEGNRAICPICQDAPEEALVSACAHVFCRQCISEQLANGDDTSCRFPKCRRPLNSSLVYTLAALKECDSNSTSNGDTAGSRKQQCEVREEDEAMWKSSSKIDAVINTLQALPKVSVLVEDGKLVKVKDDFSTELEKQEPDVRDEPGFGVEPKSEEGGEATRQRVDSTEKAIVFSQWTSMLDLLEVPLQQAGFCYRRLDGTMSVLARDRAVADFNTRPEVTVMIMSLKAASLGLNMVAACHVLLLDVWWNPTTEDQAIDRAHRIGQTRPVNVSRFTVMNTIEDRILALQERKRQIVSSAFGENEGSEQKTRLTVEDLRYLFRI